MKKSGEAPIPPAAAKPALVMEGSQDSIGFMLSKIGMAVSERFGQVVGQFGLVPRQFYVLNLICQHEGESQQAIAESVGVAKSQMVAVVDELEAKGLLERRVNPSDRRQHALYMTGAGLKARETALAGAVEFEGMIRSALTAAEAEIVIGALHKIAAMDGTPLNLHGSLTEKR